MYTGGLSKYINYLLRQYTGGPQIFLGQRIRTYLSRFLLPYSESFVVQSRFGTREIFLLKPT